MEGFTDWTRIDDEEEQARLRSPYDEETGDSILAELIEGIGTEGEAHLFKRSNLLTDEDHRRLIQSYIKTSRYHHNQVRAALKRMSLSTQKQPKSKDSAPMLPESLEPLIARLDSFEQKVTARLDGFEKRLDSFEERLTALEEKGDNKARE